ncbi:MAG: hypothetical protein HC805_07755 [Alkalinema sp. RL_2_19]|nr:hypothetical protein [Alkalinema sp. RL_2_19]
MSLEFQFKVMLKITTRLAPAANPRRDQLQDLDRQHLIRSVSHKLEQ